MINGGINKNRSFSSVTKYLAGKSLRTPPIPDKFLPGPNQSTLQALFVPFWEVLKVPGTFTCALFQMSLTQPSWNRGKQAQGREENHGMLWENTTIAPTLPHSVLITKDFCLLPEVAANVAVSWELAVCSKPQTCRMPKTSSKARGEQELPHGGAPLNRAHLMSHFCVEAFLILWCRELKLISFGTFKAYQVGRKFLQQPFIMYQFPYNSVALWAFTQQNFTFVVGNSCSKILYEILWKGRWYLLKNKSYHTDFS